MYIDWLLKGLAGVVAMICECENFLPIHIQHIDAQILCLQQLRERINGNSAGSI
jgi:hypothetical protein